MSLPPRVAAQLAVSENAIAQLCRKWHIAEFALFGSVLTDEFRPDSDVDVLVTFEPGASWTLTDIVHLRDELMGLFGRKVDVVEKKSLRNPYVKKHILNSYQVVYAA
jgi:predicted nucleotidyltransferase